VVVERTPSVSKVLLLVYTLFITTKASFDREGVIEREGDLGTNTADDGQHFSFTTMVEDLPVFIKEDINDGKEEAHGKLS
jgi:hypothetical protein